MIVMMIPILTSSISSSDPTVAALMAILPVLMIFNALSDFF